MKKDLHPTNNEITAVCACGSRFATISTNTELEVDICSQCHPLYTGQQKFVDTAGRIEKFAQRYAKTGKK